jgi:hypothetical protein
MKYLSTALAWIDRRVTRWAHKSKIITQWPLVFGVCGAIDGDEIYEGIRLLDEPLRCPECGDWLVIGWCQMTELPPMSMLQALAMAHLDNPLPTHFNALCSDLDCDFAMDPEPQMITDAPLGSGHWKAVCVGALRHVLGYEDHIPDEHKCSECEARDQCPIRGAKEHVNRMQDTARDVEVFEQMGGGPEGSA